MTKNTNVADDDVKDDNVNEEEVDKSGADDTDTSDDKSGANDNTSSDDGKTFTQDDVNRMMAKEKKQGRSSAFNELGIDPSNEKMVKAAKAFFSKLSDNDDDDTDVNDSDDDKSSELEYELVIANAKIAAMKQGVNPQYVDDVVTLVSNRMKQDESMKLDTAIGELKKKYPGWFVVEQTSKNIGKFGTGASISASSSKGADDSLGKRLAAQRKVSSSKKSYWKN